MAQRPLGPTPREGMWPSDPEREAERVWEQAKDRFDPFQSESQLARTLAHIRYKSALGPLVFGPGQTIAKVLFRIPDLLHTLPWDRGGPVGRTIDKGLAAWEQDLGTRITRDEAREYVVRERYMTPLERAVHDIARFGAEFEGAGRIAPILKAAPLARVAPEGAGLMTRALTGAGRVGTRALAEGAQFGTFEMGRSLLAPRLQRPPPPRRRAER